MVRTYVHVHKLFRLLTALTASQRSHLGKAVFTSTFGSDLVESSVGDASVGDASVADASINSINPGGGVSSAGVGGSTAPCAVQAMRLLIAQ